MFYQVPPVNMLEERMTLNWTRIILSSTKSLTGMPLQQLQETQINVTITTERTIKISSRIPFLLDLSLRSSNNRVKLTFLSISVDQNNQSYHATYTEENSNCCQKGSITLSIVLFRFCATKGG